MTAAPSDRASHAARPRVGRYELCSEIASGGMGRVYLARARGPAGFEKLVALKCIHAELASEASFVEMFFDEARIAARIAHPNVCGVFDFGEADGQHFIAMEYLLGETVGKLKGRLSKQGAREPSYDFLVARIIADAAEGLHAAHELSDDEGRSLQVVHRDVSPQNLLVTYDGNVKVVDFGIASAQGRLHRTATGSVKGKFAYMAPEQMRREAPDRRADIWALGVVLWELLTWDRLFKAGSEVDTILAVLNDPVRRPSDARPGLDLELEKIVMGALEKDRDARYATARELSQALSRWIVKNGEVIGMGELAALMTRAFATERERATELVDRARRTEPSQSLPLPLPSALLGKKTAEASAMREIPTALAPATVAAPRSAHSLLLSAGVGAAVTLTLGVVGWMLVGRSEGAPGIVMTDLGSSRPASGPDVPTVAVPPAAPAAPGSLGPAVPAGPVLAIAAPTEVPLEAVSGPGDAVEPAAALGVPEGGEPVADTPSVGAASPRSRGGGTRGAAGGAGASASDTGALHVETPGGWADVYVDGRREGRTPLDLELPRGRVRLELRPFGLAPLGGDASMRRSVTIGERPARVVVPLEL